MAQTSVPTVEKTKQDFKTGMNGAGSTVDSAISDLSERVSDLSHKVKDMSANLADESVNLVKNYPVHTAIGAAVIGFVAGAFLIRRR